MLFMSEKIPFGKLFDLSSKNVGLIAESSVAEKIQQKGFCGFHGSSA